jgi:hypothetical protein
MFFNTIVSESCKAQWLAACSVGCDKLKIEPHHPNNLPELGHVEDLQPVMALCQVRSTMKLLCTRTC